MNKLTRFSIVAMLSLQSSIYTERKPTKGLVQEQRNAPEQLEIQVVEVNKLGKSRSECREYSFLIFCKGYDEEFSIAITAIVQKALKSSSNTKVGDTIMIEYTHKNNYNPPPGARPIPVLAKGKKYPAYLSKEGNKFAPTLGYWSFRDAKPLVK
ncbi:MAG: hypothetical protein AAF518_17655 [Spirochaetota bacterium]